MERILVSVDARYTAMEALIRGVSLARRLGCALDVLVVWPPPSAYQGRSDLERRIHENHHRVSMKVMAWKNEGLDVSYYVTEGEYAKEVIRFARVKKFILWVAEVPGQSHRRHGQAWLSVQEIRHRIGCPVELIHPKEQEMASKGGT